MPSRQNIPKYFQRVMQEAPKIDECSLHSEEKGRTGDSRQVTITYSNTHSIRKNIVTPPTAIGNNIKESQKII